MHANPLKIRFLLFLRTLMPPSNWGDRAYALAKFFFWNRRLPRPVDGDFRDFLYYLRVSGEIDEPLRREVSCKVKVRERVAKALGKGHAVPLLAVLESPEEVRRFTFPRRCVIKPSHLSGDVIFREGGESLDLAHILGWFKRDLYRESGERNYRGIDRKVVVEPYLNLHGALEYKFFCIRGEPRSFVVQRDLPGRNQIFRYGMDWRLLPFPQGEEEVEPPRRPRQLPALLRAVRALAKGFFFIRVDLFLVKGRILVGELTNVPGGGRVLRRGEEEWQGYNRDLFKRGKFQLADFPELQRTYR